MNLLAIECSTEVLSVAVWSAGEVCERVDVPGPRHGDRLLPLIDAVLADARISKLDLAAVAFGCGPGAFTGVRMAVAAAQGIGYGLDIPALPVSSLAALAQEGFERGAVALDAGEPLPVASVEDKKFRAFRQAKDMQEVVSLVGIGVDAEARSQVVRHEKPLHLVVCAHRRLMREEGARVKRPRFASISWLKIPSPLTAPLVGRGTIAPKVCGSAPGRLQSRHIMSERIASKNLG